MYPTSPDTGGGFWPHMADLSGEMILVAVVLLGLAVLATWDWLRDQAEGIRAVVASRLDSSDEPGPADEPDTPPTDTAERRASPYPGFDWAVFERAEPEGP